jgi:hypothetical protein
MSDDPRPYLITYKHNRTGELVICSVWANSIKDARERFAMCEEREEAERIVSVKRDE